MIDCKLLYNFSNQLPDFYISVPTTAFLHFAIFSCNRLLQRTCIISYLKVISHPRHRGSMSESKYTYIPTPYFQAGVLKNFYWNLIKIMLIVRCPVFSAFKIFLFEFILIFLLQSAQR